MMEDKEIKKKLDKFLDKTKISEENLNEKIIDTDKSIIKKIDKKIIVEDGRRLLL